MKSNITFSAIIVFLFCFLFCALNLFADSHVLANTRRALYWRTGKKLIASDAQAEDRFGNSIAVAGDVMVVGAQVEDQTGTNAGAAYIFERNFGGINAWVEVKKIIASFPQPYDYFGCSVAIDGDVVVVGAWGEDDGSPNSGVAYVFERNAGGANAWGQVKRLKTFDLDPDDHFGYSVAVGGDVVVIGAPREDDGGSDAGAAYLFERNFGGANNWGETKKLTASDAQTEDFFGSSVAMADDVIIIGAYGDDDVCNLAGAAYIFERNAGGANTWGETKKLTASDAQLSDFFGTSVAVDGDVAIVSAYAEDSAAINAGAAYIFERNNGGTNAWGEVKKLTASDAQADDYFGGSVSVADDMALVGVPYEKAGSGAGAAYVFERNTGGSNDWGQAKKLLAYDAQENDNFGCSVAVDGDVIAIGALHEDPGDINKAGAAYVFDVLYGCPSSYIFEDAEPLPDDSNQASGSNTYATTEPDEPEHADNGGPYHSVWWDWSAPSNSLILDTTATFFLHADTHGSDFDTVLAVYTGLTVSNLTQIAANDNAEAGVETSEVSFQFNSGETYHIAVDGKTDSDTGNVVLNYAVIPEGGIMLLTLAASLWLLRNRH